MALAEPPVSPLLQLIIGNPFRPSELEGPDRAEARDAAWECPHGRLPGDPGSCQCWAERRTLADLR